jgi:hypothetical protein
MKKWLLFALVCSGLSCESKDSPKAESPQKADPAIEARLKQQATELALAVVAGDFEKVVDFTYPKVVEMAGGRDKLIASQKKTRQAMTAAGDHITIDPINQSGPIVESKGIMYSYVPVTAKHSRKKGLYLLNIIFIAVSSDGGNSWKFIDDSELSSRDAIKSMLPEFPEQLALPARQSPALVEFGPPKK